MQFKNIIGHENVKNRLIKSVNEGRISHAQLFLGPEGCGNLPMAIAYAQYISCQNKTTVDSCGECSSCVKYEKLIHPDLHFAFPVATSAGVKEKPVSVNYISQWREANMEQPYLSLTSWQAKIETGNKQLLISKNESESILKILSLKTYESEYKVMIIWHPERFNIASGNKLLKIIEEPPSKTLFILVAHDSEQIISTILSRTQLVKVGQIQVEDLQKELTKKYGIEPSIAHKIALQSDGNFINAQKLIEHSELDEEFHELFKTWMRSTFKANVPELIIWSEEIAKTSFGREKQKQFLKYGLHLFRESLIKNYGNSEMERVADNGVKFLTNFAPYIHGANCIEIIELFDNAFYHIERNANPKILFLDLSLKLTKLLRVEAPAEAE
ncbi:MAG: DNA polymerase III subunit delta' [Flavobacteriales bacterium]|nr:MAG: DNA polymerase III subunit delta' [Flavobacteriales bacterium]